MKSDGVMEESVEMWERMWFSGGVRLPRIERWRGTGGVWSSHPGTSLRGGSWELAVLKFLFRSQLRSSRLGLVCLETKSLSVGIGENDLEWLFKMETPSSRSLRGAFGF